MQLLTTFSPLLLCLTQTKFLVLRVKTVWSIVTNTNIAQFFFFSFEIKTTINGLSVCQNRGKYKIIFIHLKNTTKFMNSPLTFSASLFVWLIKLWRIYFSERLSWEAAIYYGFFLFQILHSFHPFLYTTETLHLFWKHFLW